MSDFAVNRTQTPLRWKRLRAGDYHAQGSMHSYYVRWIDFGLQKDDKPYWQLIAFDTGRDLDLREMGAIDRPCDRIQVDKLAEGKETAERFERMGDDPKPREWRYSSRMLSAHGDLVDEDIARIQAEIAEMEAR